MSVNDRDSLNSLEKELASEDATINAGKSSKERRDNAREEREKKEESERKQDMEDASIKAANASRERRKKK
jgi:hypothetical protein